MYCTKCGAQIPDNASHCPACGNARSVMPPPQQRIQPGAPAPAAPQWTGPQPAQSTYGTPPPMYGQGGGTPLGAPIPGQPLPAGGPPPGGAAPKKSIAPVIIWLAAGLILLLSMWLYFTYVFAGNPANSLRKAVDKTLTGIAEEQAATAKALGVSDALAALGEGPTQLEIWADMDLPQMGGSLSVDATMVADLPGQRAEGSLGIGTGGLSLMSLDFYLQDDLFSFSAPGLVAGTYGLHTATLGEDLANSPLSEMLDIPPGLDISFDPFAALPQAPSDDGALETINNLTGILLDASEISHAGSREPIEVNGYEMEAQPYTVTIPEDALQDYIEDAAAAFTGGLDGTVELEPLLEDIEDAIDGETTCTAYVWDGYLVRAVFVLEDGSVTLDFGGLYISDAFSVTLVSEGREVFYYSTSGEKAPEHGFYNSYTVLSVAGDSGAMEDLLYLDIYYDPSEKTDNFGMILELPAEGMYVDTFGTLEVDLNNRSLTADLYDSWLEGPDSTGAFSLGFACAPAPEHKFKNVEPVMLFELTEQELAMLMMDIMQGMGGTPGFGL